MGMFSFYNMRKPRQFEHKPIYWDPRKEKLEQRIHKVKMEMGVEETDYEQYKDAIRGSFVEGTGPPGRHLLVPLPPVTPERTHR